MDTHQKRTAFFVSDGTGITAETLGNSLLSQFENIHFHRVIMPYIDCTEKAIRAAEAINEAARKDGAQPIIVDTIVNKDVAKVIAASDGLTLDIFNTFLEPLEQSLGTHSSYTVGKSHSSTDSSQYMDRINAVHFALDNDDGATTKHYGDADVILVGVSRSGKTPSSLYLALHYGVNAANYPITEEDMEERKLPASLQPYKHKLFGLTIDPERLSAIRNQRRANSRYASITRCEDEVRNVEAMFRRAGIPIIDTTDISVEEISTRILVHMGAERFK